MRRDFAESLQTTVRIISTLRSQPWLSVLVVLTIVSLLSLPLLWQELTARGITGSFSYTDFWVYHSTTGDWLAGEQIYDVDDPFGNYLYAPIYLVGFLPFHEIQTWPLAAEVWITFSILLFWVSLQALIWTYIPSLTTLERILLAPLLFVLLVGFHPVFYGMRLGQISIVIAAIVTFAVVALERGEPANRLPEIISGILTAIGGSIKLFYAPIGAHLLLDRTRFIAAVMTGVTLAIASIAVFGISINQDYLQVLAWGEDWGAEPAHPSWGWIPGYYRPLFFLGQAAIPLPFTGIDIPLSLILRLSLVAGIIATALWLRNTDADRELFAVGILAIPLVGPQVSVHDFAVLLPAIVILLAVEHRRGGHLWLPVLGLLLLHWQAYGTYALANAPDWLPLSEVIIDISPMLQPGIYANIMLLGLATYRALEHRPPAWLRNPHQTVLT